MKPQEKAILHGEGCFSYFKYTLKDTLVHNKQKIKGLKV